MQFTNWTKRVVPVKDSYGREINYLRISLTDRCNYRCKYCMPEEGINKIPHDEIISYEDIVKVVRAASELGIEKIRFTGGEPLTRKDLPTLVEMIGDIEGITELTMTTNGSLLDDLAVDLSRAGLDRVNVSLDAVDPGVFADITRVGNLQDVIDGIEAAKRAGLSPVKLNTVVVKELNELEILPLIDFSVKNGLVLRFIELMPMGEAATGDLEGLPLNEIKEIVERKWNLAPVDGPRGNGPATYYRARNQEREGTLGFIFAMSDRFCEDCNRLRLTSRGTVRPCLARDEEYDLGVDKDTSQSKITDRLAEIIRKKPYQHQWGRDSVTTGEMSEIGG